MLTPERIQTIEANLDEARECLTTGKGLRQWPAVYHADVAPLLAGYAEAVALARELATALEAALAEIAAALGEP